METRFPLKGLCGLIFSGKHGFGRLMCATGLVLLSACSANEQKIKDDALQKAAQTLEGDRIGRLFELTHPQHTDTSYLLATFDLLCAAELQLDDTLLSAMNQSQTLVLEYDLTDEQLTRQLDRVMHMRHGQNLKSLLPTRDYQELILFFRDSLHTELSDVATIKPVFLNAMMTGAFLDCENPVSYPYVLAQEARQQDMRIRGLETMPERIGFFDSLRFQKHLEWLAAKARQPERTRMIYQRLKEAYRAANVDKVWRITRAYHNDVPGFVRHTLERRNAFWMERIQKMLEAEKKALFLAVGAAHLGGPEGLISRLEAKGYQLKALRLASVQGPPSS